MKKIVAVSLFILSSPLFAMTATQTPTGLTPSANTINTYEPGNVPGSSLTHPLENNRNDNRQDIQEEVDPCYDLSGKLLPGCSKKSIREKTNRPRRSNGGAQNRFNSRGMNENNTTQNDQFANP